MKTNDKKRKKAVGRIEKRSHEVLNDLDLALCSTMPSAEGENQVGNLKNQLGVAEQCYKEVSYHPKLQNLKDNEGKRKTAIQMTNRGSPSGLMILAYCDDLSNASQLLENYKHIFKILVYHLDTKQSILLSNKTFYLLVYIVFHRFGTLKICKSKKLDLGIEFFSS